MAADRQADTSMTLLERLQTNPGDPQAWKLFVERYQPRIQSWCLTWGLQASDAEDVAQEVIVKLFAAMSKFQYDPARSFRAWLKTVTKHAWCDFLAAGKRDPGRRAGPLDTIADSADAQSDLAREIEDGFDAELLDLAMHRVKNRVKPATWQAFHLTAVEGLTGADAAQKLQIPVAHVFGAKNRIQKMLQEEARILRNGKK
jgi:RNA polymerase sigma factor (sigma-70 family)